ncbi:hypothetical protein BJX96DRAFT_176967 [Aspergillus floccosus]
MNRANFNVGGSMPAAPTSQMPRLDDNQVMMNYIAHALHAQGTYTDQQHLAQAALSFEQKAFKDAQQRVDYDKQCNDKLVHIRDTPARQAAVMQNGLIPPDALEASGMRGVGQPSFPQQMNRAMQTNPMAGQQAMPQRSQQQQQQPPLMNPQQFPPGQQQVGLNMAAIRPITA